ncbi:MAG: glycosyltransferase [Chitinophagaceae bacterium]|nr:MAG: glycosyltransferase [Chitinophagaceae bacterium]
MKNPVLGKVKTRLARTIGEEKALDVYQFLLQHTLQITLPLVYDKIVYYSAFIPEKDEWSASGYRQELQFGKDLGERMFHAFQHEFKNKYESIGIIGSDCGELTTGIVVEGFNKLKQSEVVIGPATDGGYYFLGMRQLHKNIFNRKEWGSSTVLADTVSELDNACVTYDLLPQLHDIDREEDLQHIRFKSGQL